MDLTLQPSPLLDIPKELRYHQVKSEMTIAQLIRMDELVDQYQGEDKNTDFKPTFSSTDSDISIQILAQYHIPSLQYLLALNTEVDLAIQDGSRSFLDWRLKNRGQRLPLFMLPYWTNLARAAEEARKWRISVQWLKQLRHGENGSTKVAAQNALTVLQELPWDVYLEGADYRLHSSRLRTLLGSEQLPEGVIDVLIAGINWRMRIEAPWMTYQKGAVIKNLQFAESLRQLPEYSKAYPTRKSFKDLRDVGKMLEGETGHTIYFPANIRGIHWALYSVNVEDEMVEYRDSLGWKAQKTDIRAIETWIAKHHTREFLFRNALTPAAQPSDDSFSCGVIVINAIKHLVFGDAIWTKETRDLHRIEEFLTIVDMCLRDSEYSLAQTEIAEPYFDIESTDSNESSSEYHSDEGLDTSEDGEDELDMVPISESTPETPCKSAMTLDDEGALSVGDGTAAESEKSDGRCAVESAVLVDSPPILDNSAEPSFPRPTELVKKLDGGAKESQEGEEDIPKGSIFTYFKKISREEHLENLKDHAEKDRKLREERAQLSVLIEERKRAKAREGGKLRQQKHRDRRREMEIADGNRSPGGSKIKDAKPMMELEREGANLPTVVTKPSRSKRVLSQSQQTSASSKRQKTEVPKEQTATRTNWFSPLLWIHIEEAARHPAFKRSMSASAIVEYLKRKQPTLFSSLTRQVLGRMIDYKGKGGPKWKKKTMEQVANAREGKPRLPTREGILIKYPNVLDGFITSLTAMRKAGIPIVVSTIQGIATAQIQHLAPQIWAVKTKSGTFKCSAQWARWAAKKYLHWSRRKGTRAAQKIPDDASVQCMRAFCRAALAIRNCGISAALFVNIDQTNVNYFMGSGETYAEIGSSQVPIVGNEEKRAFTVVVGISAGGFALLLQAIWMGKTSRSLPQPSARKYQEAMDLGFRFEASQTSTYWSTYETMLCYVTDILVPYFQCHKAELGLPEDQEMILQLDAWTVHRGQSFNGWMVENWPKILRQFVPGGCTGIFQACDVGIQRAFKAVVRQGQLNDIVQEALLQLEKGVKPEKLRLDTTLSTLRDRSVGWLVDAYKAINKPELIKKAFEMCKVENFNLSYDSLTSHEALRYLRDLADNDPGLYTELKKFSLPQWDEPAETLGCEDDAGISVDVLTKFMHSGELPEGVVEGDDGLQEVIDDSFE